jgi:NAD-dependent deacetylase
MSTATPSARQVARWLSESRTAVAFTGAGISTESGIPDFRSPGGVWSKYQPVYFDDFLRSAAARHEYWRQKCEGHDDFAAARPNPGHELLATWEARGHLAAVVTQNIDGLHQLAGSRRVLELHGTARHIACLDCSTRYEVTPMVEDFRRTNQVPPCPACGGLLKLATISFGQSLPADVLEAAVALCRKADLVFAIGSSLVVEPAASLPRIARERGARLVIINRDPTPLDAWAAARFDGSIGTVLTEIERAMKEHVAN